jgi:hypothetical protein
MILLVPSRMIFPNSVLPSMAQDIRKLGLPQDGKYDIVDGRLRHSQFSFCRGGIVMIEVTV